MKKNYRIAEKGDTRKIAEFLATNGELLLPLVELIESSKMAVDELIDLLGRASIEAVLRLSAQGVAGEKQQGKKGGKTGWHGTQHGTVYLSDRKLRVNKPRLRNKGQGKGAEVEIPAYEAMNSGEGVSRRMLEILMHCVSTRSYAQVIPEMAQTVGISKSAVSREFIEASEEELRRLCERRLDEVEFLVIYIDGMVFGDHHVIGALGVDSEGRKHVLGLVEGASENGAAVTSLLEGLVERDLETSRRFYELLGLRQSGHRKGMLFFALGGHHHHLALYEVGAAAPKPPRGGVGLGHVAFAVESEAELIASAHRLEDAGFPVHNTIDHIVSKSVYLRDPDGNMVELAYNLPQEEWAHMDNPLATDRPYPLPDKKGA